MKIEDLLGIGKVLPIDKLIDIVAKATGTLTRPYFDRRDVDTEAYKIRKLAEAKADAANTISAAILKNSASMSGINYSDGGLTIESIKQTREEYLQSLPSPDLTGRVKSRTDYQEAKKQINIESVTGIAADELKNEDPVTDTKVNEDWSTRFFKYAEDVSDEEMQIIWGKILAGEIKQPNTFSLRALELLRNISKYEAEVFSRAANYAIESGNEAMLFKNNIDKFGLNFTDISILREIGIINESDLLDYSLEARDIEDTTPFAIGNILIIVKRKANTGEKTIPVYGFTQVGKQLLKLVNVTPNKLYLNHFSKFMKGNDANVVYGFIVKREKGRFQHTQPLLEFPMQ